uniref:Uncharacterized protein n=1 Tax=Anguilla anguilla TaxID=7936 RepID=A0A0E9VZB2_ANGAN
MTLFCDVTDHSKDSQRH